MSELKHAPVWWSIGIGLVLFVVYLSVVDLSLPQVSLRFSDKLNHLLAYGLLMGWFGQLVKKWSHRLIIFAMLAGLGMALEIVQGALPNRWFDWYDALANTLGILIATVALYFGADKLLGWFERLVWR